MNCRKPLFATALVLLVAACATSPSGRRQLMLVSEEQAISSSRRAYAQEMGRYQKEGKLVTDPHALKRVNVITERLVAQAVKMRPDSAKWQWSVQVIDDPKTVNAWCMAGGRMALYTGLIMKVDPTDDELAARAGYDPRAAVTLWQKMGKVGGSSPPEFLSTHPSDATRQQRLGALAPKMLPYYRGGYAPDVSGTHGTGWRLTRRA